MAKRPASRSNTQLEWEQFMEDSVERLLICRVREVEMEGDRFLLTVPSEPILYGLAEAAETGVFVPNGLELMGGNIAYHFGEHPYGYVPYAERRDKSYNLRYLYRPTTKTWKNGPYMSDPGMDSCIAGGDKKAPNGSKFWDTADKSARYSFKPMLVPLTRDGTWDRSFRLSVPDGELVRGGYMKVKWRDLEIDEEWRTHICCGPAYDVNGNLIPGKGTSYKARYEELEFTTECDYNCPLAWRSFGNVLICTQSFIPMPLASMYRLKLLPKIGLPKEREK